MKIIAKFGASQQKTERECVRLLELIKQGDSYWGSGNLYKYLRTTEPIYNCGTDEEPDWGFTVEVEQTVSFFDWILGI